MYKLTQFKNGLRLITIPMKETKAVSIVVLVKAGSRFETKSENGLAHFIEHMFFKGGKKYPSTLAVSETLDGKGATYNAFTDKEVCGYWIKIASEHLSLALDVLSDMLLFARFDPSEIERERGPIIEEINMFEDTPLFQIEEIFTNLLYQDHPLGRRIIGTKENIKSLTRPQFINYLKKLYLPSNIVIGVAGKIDQKEVEKEVEDYFSFSQKKVEKILSEKFQIKKGLSLKFKKTDQAHLCLGFEGLPISHPKLPTLKVLNALLGGSMSSRLFINIREKKGLAYVVSSRDSEYTDTGYTMAYAGVSLAKIEEAIGAILEEFKKLTLKLVSLSELKKARDLLRGKTILAMEDSMFMADFFTRQALLFKKIKTPEEVFSEIDQVAPDDIRTLAQKLFRKNKLNLAIIGPFKDKERFEKLLTLD